MIIEYRNSIVLEIIDRLLQKLFYYIGFKPSTSLMNAPYKNGLYELNMAPLISGTYGTTGWNIDVQINGVEIQPNPSPRTIHHEIARIHRGLVGEEGIKETVITMPVEIMGSITIGMDATMHKEAFTRAESLAFALAVFKPEIEQAARLRSLAYSPIGLHQVSDSEEPRNIVIMTISFQATYPVRARIDYRESGIIGKIYILRSDEEGNKISASPDTSDETNPIKPAPED